MKLLITSALVLLLSGVPTANAKELRVSVARGCPGIVHGVYYYRNAAHRWETKLHRDWTKSTFDASLIKSCKYTIWVAHKWKRLAHKEHIAWDNFLAEQARARRILETDPIRAICYVFGPYCQQALTVANCESGYSTEAVNGQYLGLFQMGDWERSKYGHGPTAIQQAKAAYAYFVDAGHSWGPWQCKPY